MVQLASWSFLQLVGLLGLVGVLSVILYGLYNAYLHPLSKFPGPKLWAAYRVPYVIENVKGTLIFKVTDFHARYGPVVRVAPNELTFTDAAAWNDIYGLLPGRRQNRKDFFAYAPMEPGDEREIIHSSDDVHARLRRIYGPAFTPKAVEEQSGMLLQYSDLLVSQLKKAIKTEPVQDIVRWYNWTTFDLIGDFAFGEAFHCLDAAKDHFFVKTIFDGIRLGQVASQLERYGLFTLLKPLIPESALQPKYDLLRYNKEVISRRIERGVLSSKVDVFNYLLRNNVKADQLSRDELVSNALTLVLAGSETTATLLTAVTYHLCKNPSILAKVQKEVRSAFKGDDEINPKSVNDLEYMIAVLSETLRIYPPTPSAFPRIIGSKGGQLVAENWVPERTSCAVTHYAAYHSPSNFTRPEEFLPGRWLPAATEEGSEFVRDKRDVLQPFSFGPRSCLGKPFAYAEMRLMLAKMLYHFDFELVDPTDNWFKGLRAFLVWDKGSLGIRLRAVDR